MFIVSKFPTAVLLVKALAVFAMNCSILLLLFLPKLWALYNEPIMGGHEDDPPRGVLAPIFYWLRTCFRCSSRVTPAVDMAGSGLQGSEGFQS